MDVSIDYTWMEESLKVIQWKKKTRIRKQT